MFKRTPIQLDLFGTLTEVPDTLSQNNSRATKNEWDRRTIVLNEKLIPYLFKRTPRKSIGFLIDTDGLKITAPLRASFVDVEKALLEKQHWILTKLDKLIESTQQAQALQTLKTGSVLPYRGGSLSLVITGEIQSEPVSLIENKLYLHVPLDASQETIQNHLRAWYKEKADSHLKMRVFEIATQMDLSYSRYQLSQARHQWGSCTIDRQIRLNWRLICCGPSFIDYVIIHELAHTKMMDHSPRFWALVSKYCPNYKQIQKDIRRISTSILNFL